MQYLTLHVKVMPCNMGATCEYVHLKLFQLCPEGPVLAVLGFQLCFKRADPLLLL